MGQLQVTHPNMHWILPINNSNPPLDAQIQPMALVNHHNLGGRLVDVIANTSKVCTSERGIIERSIVKTNHSKLSGNFAPLSHQLTWASGSQPTPELPTIAVWLDVMAVFRRNAKPYRMKYALAPGVTYADHGRYKSVV